MQLQAKLLFAIGAVFLFAFAALEYRNYRIARDDLSQQVLTEARNIRGILMATRRVYHHQFLDSGLPLNDHTLGFLPAHALSRISAEFSNWVSSGLSFNNVSERPRNPFNAADPVELEAIAYFRTHKDAKERLMQFRDGEQRRYFHFSTPIWVEQYCLKCHGDKAQAPKSVSANYVAAFDYHVGDLRGIMSIKLPVERLERNLNQQLATDMLAHALAFVGVYLITVWLLKRNVIGKLRRLQTATRRLAAGDYTSSAAIEGADEIADVSRAFDVMVGAVREREHGLREAEAYTRAIIDSAREGVVIVDTSATIVRVNPAAEKMFGYPPGELLGRALSSLMPEQQRAAHNAGFARVRAGTRGHYSREMTDLEALRKDGSRFTAEVSVSDMWSGGERHFVGLIRDVTERKRVEQAVAAERQFLQTVIDGVADPIMVIGLDFRVLMLNATARRYLGENASFAETEMLCHQVSHHSDEPCSGEHHPCPLARVRETRAPVTMVHEHTLGNGERRSYELVASPLFAPSGELAGIVESSRDITERLRAEQMLRENESRLEHMAHHDPLTGLPNRILFQDRLHHAMATARRNGRQVALLFLDLDRFKEVNDRFGHDTGDRLLREVAQRLEAMVRAEDTVARLGGDEFVVIVEGVGEIAEVRTVAEKLLQHLAQPIMLQAHSWRATVSIGIALYPEDAADADSLMSYADSAMYAAKQAGRGVYRLHGVDTDS